MAANQMDDVIRLVCSEAERLGEFLSGLNETDWAKASYCEGWVIGDVVGHLAGGAENWINSINRAVNGDSNPPEGQTFLAPGDRASNVTADSARSAYQQQGTQLLERFKTGYAQLAEVLGGLKPEDWDKQCFHRRGAMPIGAYVEVRLQELTVHGWDIRWGVDPSAQMWEDALGVMVGRVPRWVSNAFQPGLSLPAPVRYRFEVSQPVPVHEDYVVTQEEFQVETGQQGPADVTFRCNTGDYILLIFGRLDVAEAVASGRLSVEGPGDLAANFTEWFLGF